jgi:hypothetical protein
MPGKAKEKTSFDAEAGNVSSAWRVIKDVVDTLAKIAGAGTIVFAAIIANNYQVEMSEQNIRNQNKQAAFTLLSQREQAESQLRASMFSDLIDPIVGLRSGDDILADRERLMVELLTLNFHEHFEFKPLLLYVDQRLASGNIEGMSKDEAIKERNSLRSVARRVIGRQIALLIKDGAKEPTSLTFSDTTDDTDDTDKSKFPDDFKRVAKSDFGYDNLVQDLLKNGVIESAKGKHDYVYFSDNIKNEHELETELKKIGVNKNRMRRVINIWRQQSSQVSQMPEEKTIPLQFRQVGDGTQVSQTVSLRSPVGGEHPVDVIISAPDWENQTVDVSLKIKSSTEESSSDTTKNFTLTWYDLPFTDNTLLSDGYRFALVLGDMDTEILPRTANLKFIWFPQNYFPPRERPINNNYFQNILGEMDKVTVTQQ